MAGAPKKCWRIRGKAEGDWDRAAEAWERDEVGIWYGAWTAAELECAIAEKPADPQDYLRNVPAQRELAKQDAFWETFSLSSAIRFGRDITEGDWVLVFLREVQQLGVARVCSPVRSKLEHPLNTEHEIFKYRKIKDKKIFRLSRLPDAYRLIPTQGRGNVHQFNSMREHVGLLLANADEVAVNLALREMPFDKLLEFLGASAWESFCFAYLIVEEDFLPTGLSTGRTLPNVDIVGRRSTDGCRIIAQCKKHPYAQPIDPDFVSIAEGSEGIAYYFAFGGCTSAHPQNIRVVDRETALRWVTTMNGARFYELLTKD